MLVPFYQSHRHHEVLVKSAVFTEHTVQCTGCSHDRHRKGKKFISKLVHYSDFRFTTFQTNTLEVFYYLVHFNVGTLDGTNTCIIQQTFYVFPRVYGACSGYRIRSIPYAGSQLLAIVIFNLYVIP
jgi:hypothetical protein